MFGYEREMERVGEKQFRPASTWSVNGILSRLGPVGGPERSVWRFDASGAGEAARKTSETDDPLDLLPPELVRPLRDGDADAWRLYRKGWASETVVAMSLTTGRALLFRAVREATSRQSASLSRLARRDARRSGGRTRTGTVGLPVNNERFHPRLPREEIRS